MDHYPAGLNEQQVRRFASWSRWVTLVMLAPAFLSVVRAGEHARHTPGPGPPKNTRAVHPRTPLALRFWHGWNRAAQGFLVLVTAGHGSEARAR
ncbi:hypothetical protein E4K10_47085 [Streptomyces sp. T1317-0309]|nr:hypothetical protein E4K10_47085 [Streptomyces sp. T1317-0309]